MKSHKLFNVACKCLTLDESPSRRSSVAEGFSSGDVPVEDFILFCDRHLALPAVYRQMRNHTLTDLFPPELVRDLEHIYAANIQRNNGILQQVEEICTDLDKAKIAPVYLKGTAHLLDGLYAGPGERLIGDIDILVKEENGSETVEILKKSGYDLWWRVAGVPEPQSGGGNVSEHHFAPLLREDCAAVVEVHHKPVPLRFSRDIGTEMIFSEKKSVTGRNNCFVPSDRHKIVNNIIHSHLSHPARRMKPPCLRNVYDLYLISKREKPEKALLQIEESDRAGGYFLSAAGALGLGQRFYATKNKKAKWHCFVCNMPSKYPGLSKNCRKACFLIYLVLKTYSVFLKAVFRGSSREYVLRRIREPQWYKAKAAWMKKKLCN